MDSAQRSGGTYGTRSRVATLAPVAMMLGGLFSAVTAIAAPAPPAEAQGFSSADVSFVDQALARCGGGNSFRPISCHVRAIVRYTPVRLPEQRVCGSFANVPAGWAQVSRPDLRGCVRIKQFDRASPGQRETTCELVTPRGWMNQTRGDWQGCRQVIKLEGGPSGFQARVCSGSVEPTGWRFTSSRLAGDCRAVVTRF